MEKLQQKSYSGNKLPAITNRKRNNTIFCQIDHIKQQPIQLIKNQKKKLIPIPSQLANLNQNKFSNQNYYISSQSKKQSHILINNSQQSQHHVNNHQQKYNILNSYPNNIKQPSNNKIPLKSRVSRSNYQKQNKNNLLIQNINLVQQIKNKKNTSFVIKQKKNIIKNTMQNHKNQKIDIQKQIDLAIITINKNLSSIGKYTTQKYNQEINYQKINNKIYNQNQYVQFTNYSETNHKIVKTQTPQGEKSLTKQKVISMSSRQFQNKPKNNILQCQDKQNILQVNTLKRCYYQQKKQKCKNTKVHCKTRKVNWGIYNKLREQCLEQKQLQQRQQNKMQKTFKYEHYQDIFHYFQNSKMVISDIINKDDSEPLQSLNEICQRI